MGGPHIDVLRISPRFTANDWNALDQRNQKDWPKAAEILNDRLEGRFLQYADECVKSPYSGFVVLAIDSLLLETLQQFRDGVIDGDGRSKALVKRFLAGARFQPAFDDPARGSYYSDIRCGLLHQAEAKKMWLIRRGENSMLRAAPGGEGYVIDVEKFHEALRASLRDYLAEIVQQGVAQDELRAHLWEKMSHISNVRMQRGAVYAE